MRKMDKFSRLVKDLDDGELSITHIAIALSTHYRNAKYLPEGTRNIIGGAGEGSGLVHKHLDALKASIGAVELAYRRGNSPDN